MKRKKIGIIHVLIGISLLIIPLGFVSDYSSRKSLIENFGRIKIILKKGEWIVSEKEEQRYAAAWKKWKKGDSCRYFKKLLTDEELLVFYQKEREHQEQMKMEGEPLEVAPEPASLPGEERSPGFPRSDYVGELAIPYNIIFSLGIISICTGIGLIFWPQNNSREPH